LKPKGLTIVRVYEPNKEAMFKAFEVLLGLNKKSALASAHNEKSLNKVYHTGPGPSSPDAA
jgi:hypothetical protein